MHKINSRQASLLLFLMLVSLRLMYLPAYLSSLAFSDTYVVMIFGVLVESLVFIWFMWLINKYKDVTFYELMCKKCGKFVAKLLIIVIMLLFYAKKVIGLFEVYSFFNDVLFDKLEWYNFILPMALLALFMQTKNLRTYGRTMEVLFPFIILGFILVLIIPIRHFDPINLLPVGASGFYGILNSFWRSLFVFVDLPVMFIFMGNIKFDNQTNKKLIWSFILSSLVIIVYFIAFQAVFGVGATGQGLALSDLPLHATFASGVGRLDWMVIILWTFDLIFFVFFMGYSVMFCLQNVYRMKTTIWYSLLQSSITIVVMVLAQFNFAGAIEFITNIKFVNVLASVLFAIFVLVTIVSLVDKNNRVSDKYKGDVVTTRVIKYSGGGNDKGIKKAMEK